MGRLGLVILLLIPSICLADYNWKILRTIDGDTIQVQADWLPNELGNKISIRLEGIDTPEKAPKAKCAREAQLAEKSTKFVKDTLANANSTSVRVSGWDKYGGRLIGTIIIDGVNLKDMLISNNLARPYNGGAKQSWCN